MALVRCEQHGRPVGRTRNYVDRVQPLGYPNAAVLCGRPECEGTGFIWLEAEEMAAYERGQRVFQTPTFTVKIRAA